MHTLTKAFIIVFILTIMPLISGCSSKQPQPNIIYTNDAMNNWRSAKLHECNMEVQVIVLSVFEGRISTSAPMTKEEVERMHGWLMDRCVMYHKLDI